VSVRPAAELLPPPTAGRIFPAGRTVRLGDVDERGELRLDAIARYLQDVATDDAVAAGLPNAMGWVVRRTLIRVDRPALLNEALELSTWCTGSGRSWAERRTSLRGVSGAADAVCLWVQIDVDSGRPVRLTDEFHRVYGAAAGGRQVSSKLSLPKSPPADATSEPWRFRATDVDPFGHVNNAAQWALVEHRLASSGVGRRGTGEVEYAAPVAPRQMLELRSAADTSWLVDGGSAVSVARWVAS
jgi:acyl-ACP thioesterase